MKSHLRAAIIVLLLGALIVGTYLYLTQKKTFTEETASAFQKIETDGLKGITFKTMDGVVVDERNLMGKVVVVNFWASWCGPCVEEIPSFGRMASALGADKIVLVAINADSDKEEMLRFLKAYPEFKKENIFVVWESYKDFMRDFNIDKLPESFIFGKDLKLIKRVSGSIDWSSKDSLTYLNSLHN